MIKKAITFFCTGLLVLTGFAQAPDVSATTAWNNGSNNSAGFYENKGQVHNLADDSPNADVKFMLERGATQVFLMKTGIAYQFSRMQYPEGFRELSGNADPEKRKQAEMLKNDIRIETWRMDMVLVDANEKARVTTEERSSDFINYYNRDALDVHHYGKVTYHDIYPGIDWVIYLSGENMKYDFIVHPGGDPSQIVIRCSDYETLQLNEDGSCSLGNKMGMITENSPVSFQNGNPVATQFKLVENTIRFSIGDYNKNETLVIDPVVREWGTYYGGPYYDAGFSCAADLSGNVFLAGKTASLVGIAAGGHQNSHAGGYDALLVKFTSAGARLWATYYGGGADDSGDHCVTDASGNVYLSGYTQSAGSIASGGHQNIFAGGYDLYLAKFNSSGTRVWATYYGGGADEFQSYCTTDASGNVYLSGEAASSGSIASGGHQNSYGGGSHDAFLVKFNAAGVRQWGTYYGGTGDECAYTCTTDATGNVYLAGSSSSSTAIASGGHQNTSGGLSDAFLVKFNSGGARQWATYYGGAGDDLGMCCQVNGAGDIYLGGITTSSTSISSGGHQNTFGGNHDGFLVKFNAAGVRQWGTYYGDAGEDFIYADALDADGNIYIAGATGSTSAIASGGYQNTNAGYTDGFFVKFNPSGIREWGTYYGGTSLDYIYDFTINAASVIHFCGYTGSTSGIAGNGFLNTTLGSDVFLVKFTLPPGATLNFDGSNDVVNVPASPAFDFASGTVECWFNPAASSGNRCLVAMRTNTSGARWSIHVNENTNEIGVFNGAAFASIPVNINPGTWYHLAAVLTNSGTIMYLNGVNIGTIPLVLQTGSTGLPLSIGGHSDIAWPEYFEGSIDEVRIWNRPLCASEITSCMSGETPAFTNGLIADYHFNQGYDSGINTGVTTLTDATGNHHGTLQNFTLNGTTSNWIAPGGVTSGSTATPVITASISSSASVSCNGGSNGSATVAASGTGPFTYSWAPAGGTSATATGLTAGTYTCTISNGCVSILASVTITQPAAISLSTVVTPISCTSSNNGAIDLTVTGGVGPYTYAWSFGYTTQDISNLYTGTYQVTVTDANGCQATSSVISVSSASTVSTSYTAGTIACHGGTTTVTVTPTGGTMPYTYAWSPSGGNAAVSTPIGPGMYYFTVTDANGCSSSQSLVISEPAALSVSASQGTIACNGGTTTAGVSVSGGTPGYTYAWLPSGGTNATSTAIGPGTYTCTITDANGCSATSTFSITEPAALIASAYSINNFNGYDISCSGMYDGAAGSTVSGGTPGYSYTWSNGGISANISLLSAGVYTYTVTDVNGCSAVSSPVTLTQPAALSTSFSVANVLCMGASNGLINLTVTGGAGSNSFSWSNSESSEDISAVPAGSYSVTVTDANGCSTIGTVTLTEPPALNITASQGTISCNGGTTTSSVAVTGGTPGYSYAWLPSGGTNATSDAIGAGTYTCTATDINSCTSTQTFSITEPDAFVVTVLIDDPTGCTTNDGLIELAVSGGTGAYTFAWSNGATADDISGLDGGAYSVTITDANGCTFTSSYTLVEPTAPTSTYSEPVDTACQSTLAPFALSGGSPGGGAWSGPGVNANIFDPMSAAIGYNLITYTYTDGGGCTSTATDSVYVDICLNLAGTNAQTLNVYPNPTEGVFLIGLPDAHTVQVEIFAADGRRIISQEYTGTQRVEIDLENEAAGVYLVKVSSENSVFSTRIVKQ